jgi:hypothetical protein
MNRKLLILSLGLLMLSSVGHAQLSTFFVQPSQTDVQYPAISDSHYVVVNPSVVPLNKLLLYIGGTGSSPKRTTYFLNLAANLGYHVISLAYPNSISAQSACAATIDTNCHFNFRQEICYGTPISSAITVDSLNSLRTRAMKLISYLNTRYLMQNWGQFLTNSDLNWPLVVTSGHSQGSGSALYFAKTQSIDRCIMFSGANDYSNLYSSPPNWISANFATSVSRIYSFLHLQDDIIPYAQQIQVVQALGLFVNGDDSTKVDNLSSPYNYSHILYTTATPQSTLMTPYHNCTVVDFWTPLENSGNPVFDSVWTYLLTNPIITDIEATSPQQNRIDVYPNPLQDQLTIENKTTKSKNILLMNASGVLIKEIIVDAGNTLQWSIADLPAGFYFLRDGSSATKLIKR